MHSLARPQKADGTTTGAPFEPSPALLLITRLERIDPNDTFESQASTSGKDYDTYATIVNVGGASRATQS